ERVCRRSRHSAAEEDRSARQVDGTDASGARPLHQAAGKKLGEFLFSGRGDYNPSMTTRQYARLVSSWVATIGLDPHFFGTHSLRRTKATLIYRREPATLRAVQLLLGHTAYCPRKPRSTTLTIRNSVRLSSSEGVSSRTTSKWSSSYSPTARLPACQRGCS